jgi:CBS domain containing-hemolysin-like protein
VKASRIAGRVADPSGGGTVVDGARWTAGPGADIREILSPLVIAVAALVTLATFLAAAEAAISRMSRARAMALAQQRRRNADVLARIERDPAPYLNSIYFAVMCMQNGSAVLVAILAESSFGHVGVTVASVVFTLLYFVVVEAMAKTFAIQHTDTVALALAPFVRLLGRVLAIPTRMLIGLANVLLPGKGLPRGPYVVEEEIRQLAQVGQDQGAIAKQEKDLIHSVFEFGDTVVREVMTPRPDIISVDGSAPLRTAEELMLRHGRSRLPVYRGDRDRVEGVVHAKDVLAAQHAGRGDRPVAEIARPAPFVPETKRVADLLRDMQRERSQLALVTDEYGGLVGLVTLEDVLEELVGDIADEHDPAAAPRVTPAGPQAFRVDGRVSIAELSSLLGVPLPEGPWDTVAGLMLSLLGAIPVVGQAVERDGVRLTAEDVRGRRIARILAERTDAARAREPAAT